MPTVLVPKRTRVTTTVHGNPAYLADLRQRAGASFSDLETRSGISRSYLWSMEQGYKPIPLKTLDRIERALRPPARRRKVRR